MKFFSLHNIIILCLYAALGLVLAMNGIFAGDNPIGFFSIMGILVLVDNISFSQGLRRGSEVVKDVWGIK